MPSDNDTLNLLLLDELVGLTSIRDIEIFKAISKISKFHCNTLNSSRPTN